MPFFYSSDLYYGSPSYETPVFGVDLPGEYDENTDQWLAYLHAEKNFKDKQAIYSVLYETDPVTYFEKQDSLLKHNSFFALLKKGKYARVKTYLDFAKRCEALTNSYDPWECNDCPDISKPSSEQINGYPYSYTDETAPRQLSPITLEGEKLLQQCKDPSLKTRYAFLLVKLSFYSREQQRAKGWYDAYLSALDNSNWIKGSALLYIANMSPQPERDYLLSRVFDMAPSKRMRSQQLYSLKNEEGALALCKNKHEEAIVKTMQALQNPGRCIDVIREVYAEAPSNHTLPMLIVREINKLEDWLLTPKYTEFGPALAKQDYDEVKGEYVRIFNTASDKAYLAEVRALLESMLSSSSSKPDPAFLHICAGYLAFIEHDWKKSADHYAQAEQLPADPNLTAQLKLNKLWLQISAEQQINERTEQNIFDYIYQLKTQALFPEKETVLNQFILAMANLFIEKGSKAKGLMLLAHTRRAYGELPYLSWSKSNYNIILEQASPGDYEKMIAIIDKKNKTAFEIFLCEDVSAYRWDEIKPGWNRNKLLDMKATYYVQHNDIVNAYKTTCEIAPAYWNEEPYGMFKDDNPFLVNPWNGHLGMNEGNKIIYNKRIFLEKLLRLQAALAKSTGEKKAHLYYEIGNAYYSMTWHGKYWIMNRTFWSTNEPFASESRMFDDMYYGCNIAAVYYRKAMELSKDEELASVACLMLGNCEENKRRYRVQIKDRYSDEAYNDTPNPYVQQLKKKLGNTRYYDELTSNCLLFEKFLAKHM